jgi:sugar lactone lactonase YvrE
MDRDTEGRLYVVEETTQTVLVLSPEGKLLRKVGDDGPPPEGLRMLVDVAVGADGTTCLLDGTAEPCIRVFDADGKYLSGFGEHADKPEGLHMPAGVAVDDAGRIWAVDTVAHELKAFTRDGAALAIVGGMGTADGRFYFPSDVACGADGALYVTERGGDRIQAFQVETVQEAPAGTAP